MSNGKRLCKMIIESTKDQISFANLVNSKFKVGEEISFSCSLGSSSSCAFMGIYNKGRYLSIQYMEDKRRNSYNLYGEVSISDVEPKMDTVSRKLEPLGTPIAETFESILEEMTVGGI
ncbi:hypothetical protein [Solibacillus sp. FSL K6-1554]|uniref:hypothetical protein n=1 Tax=Solibacillus sp. FSL K6-1554 TaxID=2921472 RepID=UPI0030F66B46